MLNLFDLGFGFEFWYLVTILFVMGACFGSFANVVVLRAFSGESIVLPPSKCPFCHNKLKFYHNIPILSYLFLRGKCGFCKEHISIQYPLVELTYALLFVGLFLKFGVSINSIFLFAIVFMGLVLAITDIKEQVIFDNHAYILAFLGLVYNFFDIGKSNLGVYDFSIFAYQFTINKSFVFAIGGLLLGAILMELLANLGRVFVGKRAFGEGDSFILGALGAVFMVQNIIPILVLGCVIQIVLILPMFVKKLYKNKEYELLWTLGLFVFSVIIFKVLEYFNLLGNLWLFAICFFVMLFFAFCSCKKLITSAKNGEGLTYVPFGPPLVLASLVLMFI